MKQKLFLFSLALLPNIRYSVRKYWSLPGFNDKMSSCKLLFAQKGQYSSSF